AAAPGGPAAEHVGLEDGGAHQVGLGVPQQRAQPATPRGPAAIGEHVDLEPLGDHRIVHALVAAIEARDHRPDACFAEPREQLREGSLAPPGAEPVDDVHDLHERSDRTARFRAFVEFRGYAAGRSSRYAAGGAGRILATLARFRAY